MVERTNFEAMTCPIARTLEHVGEWWSILILREAFAGKTRFDEFQVGLGIAPNMLSRRLVTLTDAGMLERRAYQERPTRYEYLLTERGHDFRTVLLALLSFGNRHFAPEGESVMIVDTKTGMPVEPVLMDRVSQKPLNAPRFRMISGPSATATNAAHLASRPINALLSEKPIARLKPEVPQ